MKGKYRFVQRRNGEVIADVEGYNMVVDDGANEVLDVMFGSNAKSNNWYIGLIEDGSYVFDPTDGLDSHPGWTESTIASRVQWTISNPASTRSITGEALFNITADGDISGGFLCNQQTGTNGILHSQKLFPAPLNMLTGDTLTVYYTAEEN
jgi:hypothetical protein